MEAYKSVSSYLHCSQVSEIFFYGTDLLKGILSLSSEKSKKQTISHLSIYKNALEILCGQASMCMYGRQ